MANFECLDKLKIFIRVSPAVTRDGNDIRTGNDIGDTRITGYSAPVFWRYRVSDSFTADRQPPPKPRQNPKAWKDFAPKWAQEKAPANFGGVEAWIEDTTPDFDTVTLMLESAMTLKGGISSAKALVIAGGFFAKDGSKHLAKLIAWARGIDCESDLISAWQERLKPKAKAKNENFFDKYWRQYYQSEGLTADAAALRVEQDREAIKAASIPISSPIVVSKQEEKEAIEWLYKVEREFQKSVEELTALALREKKALYSENRGYKVRTIGRCLMLVRNDEILNLTAAKLNLQRLSA